MMKASHVGYVLIGLAGVLAGFNMPRGAYRLSLVPQDQKVVSTTTTQATTPEFQKPFDWNTLESTNYVDYIRNLRGVGCPDDTICIIMKGELDKMFAERWQQIQKPITKTAYWQAVPPAWIFKNREKTEIARYESEKAALLQQLMGATGPCGCDERALTATHMLFSSDDRRSKVELILAHFEISEKELEREASISANEQAMMQARLNLIAQKRQALLEILSPEELKQLELSTAPRAIYLRERLYGFQPSRNEFEAIYDYYGAEQGLYASSRTSNSATDTSTEARAEMDAKLKATLGEDRFAQFQLQENNDYRFIGMLGQMNGWDPKLVSSALKVLQENIEAERSRDPSVEMRKIKTQRDGELRAILGDERFELFRKWRRPFTDGKFTMKFDPEPVVLIGRPVFQYW